MKIKTYSVLVIDDQDDLREMVAYQLQALGYIVQTASNGIEALKRLVTFTPDVIILDVSMPKMDGITFYKQICDNNDKPKYSVIVHTARVELSQFFLDFHVEGFLSKPANIDELLREVDLVIKKKNRQKDPKTGIKSIKEIFIVEDDKDEYLKIHSVFEKSGYKVNNANNGVSTILKMLKSPADVVLTKLSLKDISGDVLALRLKTLARTSDIITIVYMNSSLLSQSANIIHEKLKDKTGIEDLVKYVDERDLLEAVDKALRRASY